MTNREPLSVLLVEAEPSAVAALVEQLEATPGLELRVETVPTVADATRLLRSRSVDLVVVDTSTPGDHDDLRRLTESAGRATVVALVDAREGGDGPDLSAAGVWDRVVGGSDGMWDLARVLRLAQERREAEEIRQRYLSLFESSSDAVCFANREGKIVDVNPALLELFGYEPGELAGMSTEALFLDADQKARLLRAVEERGAVRDFQARLGSKDGGERYCLVSMVAKKRADGTVDGYQIIIRDVTTTRAAHESLRQSEERFRWLAGSAPDVIYRYRLKPDRELEYVSPAITAVAGYLPEEIYSDPNLPFRLVYPDDRQILEDILALRIDVTGPITIRWLHKNGSIIWTELRNTVISDPAGDMLAIEGIARDVTQRSRTEQRRLRLTEIIEATPDLVAMVRPDGRLVYLNPAGRGLLGMPSDSDVLDMLIWDLHREPWSNVIRHEAFPIAARDGTWSGETALETRDGRELPVSQVVIAHRGARGEVELYSTVARDISARRALENQLQQAQKQEAIGRLAGGVAHDFNNVLTAILGNCELLLAQLPHDHPGRGDAEEVRRAAGRAADLTRQLLALGRKQVLHPEVIDPRELIENTQKLLRRLIGEDIELLTHHDPDLGQVRVDPGQLEQVIVNLAVNARDAMPQGGMLVIETRNVDLDFDYVRSHDTVSAGPYVQIAVSDTGRGIEQSVLPRIFEPFFTTKPNSEGSGLGLAMVYGIVKQSGGYVWVYSRPRMGTTFKIYLPRVEASIERASALPLQPVRGGSETVLIVEDEEAVRKVVARLLRGIGYSVLDAEDPEEAETISDRLGDRLDILVTDVVMPKLSGPDLVQRLRRKRPDLRVLYISGYTDQSIIHRGVLGSETPFLQKPFGSDTLARKLREVLDGPPARRQEPV